MHTTKIGLFGIGLDAYWPQFKGLKQRLEGYLRVVQKNLERPSVEIFNLGLIEIGRASCRERVFKDV